MSELEISVTDDQLREVVVAAVASALTTEKRDALLRQAIEGLLNKAPSYKTTTMQDLFNKCVNEHVYAVLQEQLQREPYKGKLEAATTAALDKLLVANMGRVTDEAAKQIGYAIRKGFVYDDD